MEFENYVVNQRTGQTLHKTHVWKLVYLFMRHPNAAAQHDGGGAVVYFSTVTHGVWC